MYVCMYVGMYVYMYVCVYTLHVEFIVVVIIIRVCKYNLFFQQRLNIRNRIAIYIDFKLRQYRLAGPIDC